MKRWHFHDCRCLVAPRRCFAQPCIDCTHSDLPTGGPSAESRAQKKTLGAMRLSGRSGLKGPIGSFSSTCTFRALPSSLGGCTVHPTSVQRLLCSALALPEWSRFNLIRGSEGIPASLLHHNMKLTCFTCQMQPHRDGMQAGHVGAQTQPPNASLPAYSTHFAQGPHACTSMNSLRHVPK